MSNPCHDGSDLTNGPLYAVKLGTTPPTGRDDSRAKHLYMRLLSSLKGKMTQQFHIHLIWYVFAPQKWKQNFPSAIIFEYQIIFIHT